MSNNLPVADPKPDSKKFIDVLLGRERADRPPLVEYIVDDVVMEPIVRDLLGRAWVEESKDRKARKAYLDNFIEFWYRMGYDFVKFERGLELSERHFYTADTAPTSYKERAWADEHQGSITNWKEFEKFRWPKVEEFDFSAFEYVSSHLPEGMGLMTSHGGGIFEHLSWIMSYERLCLSLHDDPTLVQAISDKLGGLMTKFYEHLLDLNNVIAIFAGDDMGFRSSTLVSPVDLRKYCLPWHKKFAEMAHQKGIPYFLHSCGNIEPIIEDLISDIRIDGKHSFEDAIIPVQDFQARYGDRIAVLGGMDINILSGSSPERVQQHTRFLMETCGKRGRYAIGSGNSIPSYVPVENYLAMIDEALK
jgi:uroporphyrinogen decarboxylase